jgi:hypothetical protein
MALVAVVVVRLGAGDEGVEALEPMHEALLHQRFERAIDLQRRAEALVAQLVEQRIGTERSARPFQLFQHVELVLGQHLPPSHLEFPNPSACRSQHLCMSAGNLSVRQDIGYWGASFYRIGDPWPAGKAGSAGRSRCRLPEGMRRSTPAATERGCQGLPGSSIAR